MGFVMRAGGHGRSLARRQSGMALVIVMMLFAILATLATEVLYRQDRFRTRAEHLLDWSKRYRYAQAVEVVAVRGLDDSLAYEQKNNIKEDDCSREKWAVQLPPTPYDDAVLSASVQDLQGRFNLNWLVTAKGGNFVRDNTTRDMLKRLLQATLPDPSKAGLLANEMTDWIDSNNIVDAVDGAEDPDYRLRRTPNMPVADASELRALRDFTVKDLFPDPRDWGLFAALPVGTRLNLNTAPRPVLDAVLGAVAGAGAADTVIRMRQQKPITSVGEVMSKPPFSSLTPKQSKALGDLLGVSSDYFQVMVDVKMDGNVSRLISRIQRLPSGNSTHVYSREMVPVLTPLEPACNPFYNEGNNNNANVIKSLPAQTGP